MRLYVAGPMSGLPEMNYPAFRSATEWLRSGGWDVVSPHELFPPDPKLTREECLKVDLKELLTCDAIGLLPGSDKSIGAQVELSVARAVGLKVYDLVPSDRGPLGTDWFVLNAEAICAAPFTVEASAPAETILEEAQRLVHGDRGKAYGHPIHDYTRTGRIWGAILGLPDIDPRICCLMMAGVKISREVNGPKRDNRTDLAGYAECCDMVAVEQERRGT